MILFVKMVKMNYFCNMKKILLILAALTVILPAASAQSDSSSPFELYSTENGVFGVDLISHLGVGAHLYSADNFVPKTFGSFEAFFNLVNLKIYPIPVVGIEAGADLEFNWFRSIDNYFYTDSDRNFKVGKFIDIAGEGASKLKSNADFFGLNFPVLLKLRFGEFRIGAGAQAMLNFSAGADYHHQRGNMVTDISFKDAKANLFSYAFIGQLSYSVFGVYFKYYPKQPVFFPATEGAPSMKNLMTVGLQIGF